MADEVKNAFRLSEERWKQWSANPCLANLIASIEPFVDATTNHSEYVSKLNKEVRQIGAQFGYSDVWICDKGKVKCIKDGKIYEIDPNHPLPGFESLCTSLRELYTEYDWLWKSDHFFYGGGISLNPFLHNE